MYCKSIGNLCAGWSAGYTLSNMKDGLASQAMFSHSLWQGSSVFRRLPTGSTGLNDGFHPSQCHEGGGIEPGHRAGLCSKGVASQGQKDDGERMESDGSGVYQKNCVGRWP